MRYNHFSVLSIFLAVPLADLATPPLHLGNLRVKHMWDTLLDNWEDMGPPSADTTVNLSIALKPHRENALVDALLDVSEPGSPIYGAHLSKKQVADLVAPRPETLDIVTAWLQHHGVSNSSISTTHGGGWLTVSRMPVSQANKLLNASYQLYRHNVTNDTILRTTRYSLPHALHTLVQTVVPTTSFVSTSALHQTPLKRPVRAVAAWDNATLGEPGTTLSKRAFEVTPDFLRWLYKTTTYRPATAKNQNRIGIVGMVNQFPSETDLIKFISDFRSDALAEDPTFTVRLVQVNGGGYDPSNPGFEANIDLQYAVGLSFPTQPIFYSAGGNIDFLPSGMPNAGDMYLALLHHLLSLPDSDLPQTLSISYGTDERFLPQEYTFAVCGLFSILGGRGVSVLISSGDFGVGMGNCIGPNGGLYFSPLFPASCPYVTSVGGTMRYNPEFAADLSGGGFSNHFVRERYQNPFVYTFFQWIGTRHYGLYNPIGRGVPDISAQALGYSIILNGNLESYSGTSCSTPTVASIISLLNDYRIWKGLRPLGFLNPLLYGPGLAGFNDIIYGSNPACNTNGFPATPGWDPVTGLGTPDFMKLLAILGNL